MLGEKVEEEMKEQITSNGQRNSEPEIEDHSTSDQFEVDPLVVPFPALDYPLISTLDLSRAQSVEEEKEEGSVLVSGDYGMPGSEVFRFGTPIFFGTFAPDDVRTTRQELLQQQTNNLIVIDEMSMLPLCELIEFSERAALHTHIIGWSVTPNQ
jgi:hypothetical protein